MAGRGEGKSRAEDFARYKQYDYRAVRVGSGDGWRRAGFCPACGASLGSQWRPRFYSAAVLR